MGPGQDDWTKMGDNAGRPGGADSERRREPKMPKRQKAKRSPPSGEKKGNFQNRQAGWRKVEKKGTVVGKKK